MYVPGWLAGVGEVDAEEWPAAAAAVMANAILVSCRMPSAVLPRQGSPVEGRGQLRPSRVEMTCVTCRQCDISKQHFETYV